VRSYTYDAAGNTKSYTGVSFVYNQRGRMTSAATSAGTTNYLYNALGQLVQKSGAGGTTLLLYDEAGHLLGEYSSTGTLIQETIWMDNVPVATLRPNGSAVTIYYVHTDHLNAPRIVTQSSSDNSVRWLWGGNAANQNPLSLGTFIYNLRFPGQYYMAETGLFYNYFRDYDPQTGRYIESDPIGLSGGINTYVYASGNPVSRVDPLGLDDSVCMFNRAMCDPSLPVDPQQQWNIPAATKAKICALLKSCDGDVHCAWRKADDTRLAYRPDSWSNLEDREVENFLTILDHPNDLQGNLFAIYTYETIYKMAMIFKTTRPSPEALSVALEAYRHENAAPVDLAKMCNDCGK
jgi:RHS repeat-associated protein